MFSKEDLEFTNLAFLPHLTFPCVKCENECYHQILPPKQTSAAAKNQDPKSAGSDDDIFNQYFPHPDNTDEQKTSEFVAKDICITNHNIYVITYCTITAKYKQPSNGMIIHLCCLATTQALFRAISSLLASSFLCFPFRYQERTYAL